MVHTMDTPTPTETAVQHKARIEREAEIIARGHAQIDAGLYVEEDALDEWLDAVEHGEDPPIPVRGQGGARRP